MRQGNRPRRQIFNEFSLFWLSNLIFFVLLDDGKIKCYLYNIIIDIDIQLLLCITRVISIIARSVRDFYVTGWTKVPKFQGCFVWMYTSFFFSCCKI